MRGDPSEPRIGDLAEALDAERFVGRSEILDRIDRALAGEGTLRVLHVHGPGGVGKSALLRAAGRRARASGHAVVTLDGRVLDPSRDALAEALAPAVEARTTMLVLVDEVDELAPLRVELRRLITDELPASTVVVTAGRRAPGPEWLDGGLDRVTATLDLLPLDATESRLLLAKAGVDDPAVVAEITAWSAGYPLALTLAAARLDADPERPLGLDGSTRPAGHPDGLVLDRLGGAELRGIDPEVLEVAAVAPAVDARLLAAVLPGRSTRSELAALRACSLSEPIGPRVTLHRLARTALAARLTETDPEGYRHLVVAVADHLRARADTEGARVLPELASLIEDPGVRLGFDRSTTHYADRARPGDTERLAAATGRGDEDWFGRLARWIEERPNQVVMVRRVTGEVSAAAVVYSGSTVPLWALEAVETGPVVELARARGHLDDAQFLQDVTLVEQPLDEATTAEIFRVGNAGLLAAIGRRSFRYAYVTSPSDEVAPLEFLGYVEVPELRRTDGQRELTTIWCDFGPGGLVGRAHDVVRTEQGAPPWAEVSEGGWLADGLRSFHDDDALRALTGLDPAATRAALRAAVERAFPDDDPEGLRRALELTYLDPDGGHGVAQRALFMSRSSFYRLLQRARRQLVERGAGPG